MLRYINRSILIQLLSMYLIFVTVVLIAGFSVNAQVEHRLSYDAQASDQALAQEIALETSARLRDAENSLVSLSSMVMQAKTPAAMLNMFRIFQSMRSDVDHVSWLDPVGGLLLSWPLQSAGGYGAEYSPPNVIQRARLATSPVFEVGIAVETTFNAGVIIAQSARTPDGKLVGIVVASLSLLQLSKPLVTVVHAQQQLKRRLIISIIDERGELIATPWHQRILQTVLDELPGAEQALKKSCRFACRSGSRWAGVVVQLCSCSEYGLGGCGAEAGG